MAIPCPECQFKNPEDTSFCGKCGGPLKPAPAVGLTKTLIPQEEILKNGGTLAGKYRIIE